MKRYVMLLTALSHNCACLLWCPFDLILIDWISAMNIGGSSMYGGWQKYILASRDVWLKSTCFIYGFAQFSILDSTYRSQYFGLLLSRSDVYYQRIAMRMLRTARVNMKVSGKDNCSYQSSSELPHCSSCGWLTSSLPFHMAIERYP